MTSWIHFLTVPWILVVFGLAAVVIGFAGTRLTGIVDELADRTRLGEAITGGLLLGATTSLPDIVVSTAAAAAGRAEIAVSNAVGGIAVQTVFLVVADVVYRRGNLEHAAASLTNMIQATLLIVLLAIPIVAAALPGVSWAGFHPASLVIFASYLLAQRMAMRHRDRPLWHPTRTKTTVIDQPDPGKRSRRMHILWLEFAAMAVTVAAAGYIIAGSGMALTEKTGLSDSAVGAVFTGVSTSCGELVTSIAAVRRGALTLAVGGIIGGNTFDSLLIPISDFAYREGSIYHAISAQPIFITAVTILMTAVLLMGLLRRQERGPGNIGFEGGIVLLIYAGMTAVLLIE